jgi:hypothetical protein
VLHTPGLDEALATGDLPAPEHNRHQQRRWIDRSHGLVVLAAPPPVLRSWAVQLSRLGERFYQGNDTMWLDRGAFNGEIQILEDFAARVATARAARERLFPGRSHAELTEEEREQVWQPAAGS